MKQKFAFLNVNKVELEQKVRLIVELLGKGEALDEEEVIQLAGSLYDAGSYEVKVIIANLRMETIKRKFYLYTL